LGATLALLVVPSVLGTAAASARAPRPTSMQRRALALHRAENRWHMRQMDSHRAPFRRLNRSVHRRFPMAGPFADLALQGTHVAHGGMEWGDNMFLGFHEGFMSR